MFSDGYETFCHELVQTAAGTDNLLAGPAPHINCECSQLVDTAKSEVLTG